MYKSLRTAILEAVSTERKQRLTARGAEPVEKATLEGPTTSSVVPPMRDPMSEAHSPDVHARVKALRHLPADALKARANVAAKRKDVVTGKDDPDHDTVSAVRHILKSRNISLDESEYLEEKITKSTPLKDIINDFVHSDDPRFDGKSTEERRRMALGAYYSMHPELSRK